MCFYDQYEFACKDFRWGNFRMHCNKEYRRGETCGMKLVHEVIHKEANCSLCEKINTKTRRFWAYEHKIQQWEREGRLDELSATVEKTRADQMEVRKAIDKLNGERNERAKAIGRYVRGGSGTNGYAYPQQSYSATQPQASSAYASNGYEGYGYANGYDSSSTSSGGYTFGYNT